MFKDKGEWLLKRSFNDPNVEKRVNHLRNAVWTIVTYMENKIQRIIYLSI